MDLEHAHKASSGNETALRQSTQAGCFYCCHMFVPDEIKQWVNDPPHMGLQDGRTAICPQCGIDSVLPDAVVPLTATFLKMMKKRWF